MVLFRKEKICSSSTEISINLAVIIASTGDVYTQRYTRRLNGYRNSTLLSPEIILI